MRNVTCNDVTNLDTEVTEVKLTEDFMDNSQTLRVWNHGVVLTCHVKILKDTQTYVAQRNSQPKELLNQFG